ncbi:precorrin-2 dehydrogenase/sirohydrochlorin ferrochelatase [Natranaerovirga hydrolytica]|uniref:precorrin-2 dehydrogenase n=1 Tax=Natranaerovirga hydrolytica TaxID=680378 RepID=A0A4V2Q063_9FIRM|nr:bifunctional precorrin-2 dehydrogenase/sirohydrochlorin ferrochelatase [Natranaerovirga hydrolytica]TCK92471.1 precorrin-2 dehydrogenase/sirohydrochlorin ferrochelatase [Natranaerovirga hydrolytica]
MYLPIMLEVENKNILIIGAGTVAYKKAQKIVEQKGNVKVVSPRFNPDFDELKNIKRIKDVYDKKYIKGHILVIAATDHPSINKKINEDCREENVLCNVVTDTHSDVIFPSHFNRGDLTMAVSTNGKSPALSKKIINDLKQHYDESYEERVQLLGEIRDIVLSLDCSQEERRDILNHIVELEAIELRKLAKKEMK